MKTTKSIQALLNWLEQSGQLNKKHQAEAFILSHTQLSQPAVTVQILLGIGALLGCIFILSFLQVSQIIDFKNTRSLISAGIFLVILALCLNAIAKQNYSLIRLFLTQSAFAFIVTGKALFIIGFFKFSLEVVPKDFWFVYSINASWLISLGLLITTLMSYFLFPLALERALSCFFLLLSLMLNAIIDAHHGITLFSFYSLLLLSTCFLFTWKNKTASWSPLANACTITLILMGSYLATVDNTLNFPLLNQLMATHKFYIPLKAFNIATSVALIGLCAVLMRANQGAFFTLPMLLACLAILTLAWISSAGILIALAFLVLGYANHERILTITGIVGLGLFLILFYYNLPVSFIQKSQTLALSGLVLLAARFFIKYQKWDRS